MIKLHIYSGWTSLFNISILTATTEINIFENNLTLGEYIGWLVLGAVEVSIFSSDGNVY